MYNNLPLVLTKAFSFCLFIVIGIGLLLLTANVLTHRATSSAAMVGRVHHPTLPAF